MQEKHGMRGFDFIPRSFVLPKDADALRNAMIEAMQLGQDQFFISKPACSSQGKGIVISNKFNELTEGKKGQITIVSDYISNPLLIDGLKFDLRIYVALTSINPLRIYMYEDGLTRFAT